MRPVGAVLLALVSGLVVFPVAARADCVERMSRIPMAAPAGPAAPRYRAAMLRTGPAPAVKRPKAVRAKAAVRKAHVVRKAGAARPAAKIRRAAAPRPAVVASHPRPTPMPTAAAELATPLSYALIASTVCETGAAPVPPMRLAMARAPLEPELAAPEGPTNGVFFPTPDTGSPLFPTPGGGPTGPLTPIAPPEVTPPVIIPPEVIPPEVTPPVVTPPEVTPPVKPPLTPEPPITTPPVTPPTGPPTGPPILPPINPPVGPPVTAIPEPATWALMMVGFGLLGLRLRRRRETRPTSS